MWTISSEVIHYHDRCSEIKLQYREFKKMPEASYYNVVCLRDDRAMYSFQSKDKLEALKMYKECCKGISNV